MNAGPDRHKQVTTNFNQGLKQLHLQDNLKPSV